MGEVKVLADERARRAKAGKSTGAAAIVASRTPRVDGHADALGHQPIADLEKALDDALSEGELRRLAGDPDKDKEFHAGVRALLAGVFGHVSSLGYDTFSSLALAHDPQVFDAADELRVTTRGFHLRNALQIINLAVPLALGLCGRTMQWRAIALKTWAEYDSNAPRQAPDGRWEGFLERYRRLRAERGLPVSRGPFPPLAIRAAQRREEQTALGDPACSRPAGQGAESRTKASGTSGAAGSSPSSGPSAAAADHREATGPVSPAPLPPANDDEVKRQRLLDRLAAQGDRDEDL